MLILEYIRQGYIQYGLEELNRNATMNSLSAQYYVAVCFENGIGVEKNLDQAFRMYRKAAERGLPDAMYHLASFYRNGVVVSCDSFREDEWLRRFNQKGGQMTLPDLVSIYNEGVEHPENYALNPNGTNNNAQNQISIETSPLAKKAPVPINIVKTPPANKPVVKENKSDVDLNIPLNQKKQENAFALIIANENYHDVAAVPNALNDGTVFAEYCKCTLGIPQSNIKFLADATLNQIRRQINWLCQVVEAYQGEARIIFYYAGHGIPCESNGSAYLLPVDGYGNDISTGYQLEELYTKLGRKPTKNVVILLDACFSGTNRDGSMLYSARGVAIKAKPNSPKGNMIVLSAAQDDETAYPYKEMGHGMFTYYLLKKLQETKGDATIGELSDYVSKEVKRQSVVHNGKMQTPTVNVSSSLQNSWRNMKLK